MKKTKYGKKQISLGEFGAYDYIIQIYEEFILK